MLTLSTQGANMGSLQVFIRERATVFIRSLNITI
jgi:hypothetical protein